MSKVLYVIGSLGLGGAESQLLLLMKTMKQKGQECCLFAIDAKGPLRGPLDELGIEVYDGGYRPSLPGYMKIYRMLCAFFKLIGLIHRYKPAVLHAYLPLANFLGSTAGFLTWVPVIITSKRAMGNHQDRYPLLKISDRISNLLSTQVTVNSQAVGMDTIRRDRINPGKLVHIPNGLVLDAYGQDSINRGRMRDALGLTDAHIGIVNVANLIAYKGQEDLLHGISSMLHKNPNIILFLVGEDRGIEASLRELAESLGITQQVKFLGQRLDVPDILAAMDMFVLASHEEGCSNALIEAMASGLPIVATDVGGNRELLDDGQWGALVPPKNPELLGRAIEDMVVSVQGSADNKSDHLRHYVQSKYSVNSLLRAHLDLYRVNVAKN